MWPRILMLLFLSFQVNAATWYVATNATASGDGTILNPFKLSVALQDNTVAANSNHVIAAGDSIYGRAGTYVGAGAGFVSFLKGSAVSPITIQPYPGERFTIDGNYDGVGGSDNIVTMQGAYARLVGVEVMDSYTNRGTVNGRPAGIVVGDNSPANGIGIINCITHDCGDGVFVGRQATNCFSYGCLNYNDGYQNVPPDRGHGHGIYVQNFTATGLQKHQENICLNIWDIGFQAFDQGGAGVENMLIEGNISANSGAVNDTTLRTANFIIYSSVHAVKSVTANSNFAYHFPGADTNGGNVDNFDIGSAVENSDCIVSNQYLANGIFSLQLFTNAVVSKNTFLASDAGMTIAATHPGAGTNGWLWDANTYAATKASPFDFNGFPQTFASWKAVSGFDATSTFSGAAPNTSVSFARPNAYQANRANIVIFNWASNDNVNVDLTGIVSVGQPYAVANAFDFYGTPVKVGTYSGGTISLPMTNLNVVAPLGVPAARKTSPGFGVFILLPTTACFRMTNTAASASFTDVAAAAAISTSGQVVQVPPGTATWTQSLTPPAGVSIIGSGTNVTVFIDELSRTPNAPLFNMSGTNFEISGFTIRGGTINVGFNNVGEIKISASNFRMHDIFLDKIYGLGATIVSTMGLVDHMFSNLTNSEVFQTFSTGFGDDSWSTPVQPGSINNLYFEDNYFANNAYNPAIDAYAGSRIVIRHNTYTNSWTGNHGTDSSQRQRGCRWMEVYQNNFFFPTGTGFTPWPWVMYYRSGSGVVFSNSFNGRYTAGVKMATYRNILDGSVTGSPNWVPWGGANGSCVWDGNTDGFGYPVLDQCGRGQSDLIVGSPPINNTTGTPTWPHNAPDPIYVWNNVMNIDTAQEAGVQQASIIQNRDYFIGTPKPGYTPLQYPHPLQTGCFAPGPTPTPPNPKPQVNVRGNLRVTGNVNMLK